MTSRQAAPTLAHNRKPHWVRGVNWGGRQLQQVGIQPIELTEASLLTAAQKQSQLSDWGDESFLEGLRTLLTALNQEANLSLMGRVMLRQYITRLLVNRLQIQATLKQHPEISAVPIQRPLVITGLPRTGTTLLQRLLAQDPKFRWLHLWELMQPCPPPTPAAAAADPRIAMAQTLTQRYQTIAPALSTAHFMDASIPEEGNPLFEHAFANILFELRAHIPSYSAWLRSQTMVPQYQYYRQQLQLLSWRWPGRWLLKAPAHLRHLAALLQVFPDACVVQLHRDPVTVVPSICSLAAIVRSAYTDRLDLATVGRDWCDLVLDTHRRGREFRRQNPAAQICDVDYRDLVQDPLGTVRQIYGFWGESLSPEAAQHMQQWLGANPQNKHGVHRYSLAEFGLDEAEVRASFA